MPLGNSQGILHPCEKHSLLPEIFNPEWSRAHGLKFLSSCAQLLWKESPLHRNEKSVFILRRMFLISAGNRHDFFPPLFFFSDILLLRLMLQVDFKLIKVKLQLCGSLELGLKQ